MAAIRIVVADASSPTSVDTALATILEDGGNNTTDFVSDDAAEDLTGGIACVVYANSVAVADISSKYRNPTDIGVVSLRCDITDGQNWHAGAGTTSANAGLDIIDQSHALANGLTTAGNTHTIFGSSQVQQGTTTAGFGTGTIVGHRGGSGSIKVLVGWDIGDTFDVGTVCAGRHVIAGFAANSDVLNATGQALLLNAVQWAGQFGPYAPGGSTVFGPEDDFSTDEIATNFPAAYEDVDAPAEVTGGRYVVTLADSVAGSNYSGLITASGDFTGKAVFVQVVAVPTAANSESYLKINVDASNSVWMGTEDGDLVVYQRVSGTTTLLTTVGAFNAVTHRFWQIREDSGTTYFETSSDGETWTERHSVSNPITVTTVTAETGAGTFDSVASPGTFELEAFNVVDLSPIDHTLDTPVAVARDLGQSLGMEYEFDPLVVVRRINAISLAAQPLAVTLQRVRVVREIFGLKITYTLHPVSVVRSFPANALRVKQSTGDGNRRRRRVAMLYATGRI